MERTCTDIKRHHSFFGIFTVFVIKACMTMVDASCTFPSSLVGQWDRGYDNTALTFTSTDVTGMGIPYFATVVDSFTCDSESGNTYVIAASYTNLNQDPRTFYICWYLQEVTSSAFILYELTSDLSESGFNPTPGYTDDSGTVVSQGTVCDLSTSSTLFTTLIINGATATDVAAECPSSLFATYTYGLCVDTELDFCVDRKTATADYTKCSTNIFNSVGGVLSCMGYQEVNGFTYVNLYNQDAGNGVTCVRIASSTVVATEARYYSGDCTTASGSDVTLTLTATAIVEEEGASSANAPVGLIVGVAFAVVVIVGGVVTAVYFLKRGQTRKAKIVHADDAPRAMENGNGVTTVGSPEMLTAPAMTLSSFPYPGGPETPRRLPPIETMGSVDVPTGVPLRH